MIINIWNVPAIKIELFCSDTTYMPITCIRLRHQQPINRVAPNNHHLNVDLLINKYVNATKLI